MDDKARYPRNVTASPLGVYRLRPGRKWHTDPIDRAFARLRLEDADMARAYPAYKGKRNYDGFWASSSTGGHVPFESLLERDCLLDLDRRGDVLAVAAQPFTILWPYQRGDVERHTPDYFVRRTDGTGLVVDVRSSDRIRNRDARQFQRTKDLCAAVGLDYEQWQGLPADEAVNLRWLAGYRHERHNPGGDATESIAAAFTVGATLRMGVARAVKAAGLSEPLALAAVYHLIWSGRLTTDLVTPLGWESFVEVAS